MQKLTCWVLFLGLGLAAYCQTQPDTRADSLRVLATGAPTAAEASDRWLDLSKHYRKSNLDSSQAALTRAIRAAKSSGDTDRQTRCNMSQAALKWMQGDFVEAEERYLQSLAYWKGKNDTVEVTRCLLNLGTVCQGAHKDEQAAKYLKTALILAQKAGQQLIAAQAAGSIATVSFQMGLPDSVSKYSEIAKRRFVELNDSANLARVHANLGYYYRELGMSYEARQPYLEALAYLEGTDETGLKGEIHDGYGTLEYRIGNFEEAIGHFRIAGDCFQQMKWYKRIADNNNIIGLCFKTLGRKATAQAYFAQAYRLADSIQNAGSAAAALSNLASIDREEGRYLQAVSRFKEAIRLESLGSDPADIFNKLMGLGLSNQALGQRDSADHYLALAFAEAHRHKNASQIAECHQEKAKLYFAERQYPPALTELDSARAWYAQVRDAQGLQHVYALRSQCHEAMGDYLAAVQDQRLASQWQDSVLSISANTQLLALEAKFWSEKKQHALEMAKQNEALQAKEVERAQASSEKFVAQRNLLITALALTILFGIGLFWLNQKRRKTQVHRKLAEMRMTALRAQMNPHFIFNALGSVQLLINTSAIKEANLYLSKFAQLLRNTLERSDSQDSTLQDEIDALKLYIDLEALRFKFKYIIEVDPTLDASNIYFPSLLLQPIVENAVKHGLAAKPQEGWLRLSFSLSGKDLFCRIEDNGVGRNGVKKRSPDETADHRSYGLQITQERLALLQPSRTDRLQIQDLLQADGTPSGTCVEIKIPYQLL